MRVESIVSVAKALSDPARVRMLAMVAKGRACCALPTDPDTPNGICVCEFVEELGMIQSRVSYHIKVLREAGLIQEETRGKWTYYWLNPASIQGFVAELLKLMEPPGTDAGNGGTATFIPVEELSKR